MAKTVLLVGHCGADNSYMRMVIRSADNSATVVSADDDSELKSALDHGVDLILFNRELGYGFEYETGVDNIRHLKAKYPATRMMLVSNYSDAQASALAVGAVPGFGKREIGSKRVTELLRDALEDEAAAA